MKRVLLQLSPHSWMTVKWEFTRNWRRFLTLQILLFAFQVKDLNSFFLKDLLWVPSDHPLNVYRLCLLFVIGLPSLRQLYIYTSDEACKRLGSQAWVLALIVIVEALICIKFGNRKILDTPVPFHVKVIWAIIAPVYVIVCVAIVLKNKKASTTPTANDIKKSN